MHSPGPLKAVSTPRLAVATLAGKSGCRAFFHALANAAAELQPLLVFAAAVLVGGAFCRHVSAQVNDASCIYSVDLDGDNLKILADETTIPGCNNLGSPSVSHDGRWLQFDAMKGSAFTRGRVMRIAIAGPEKGSVVDAGPGLCGVFSPDDKQLAFHLTSANPLRAQAGIWVMNADGSGRERIGRGFCPQWSPDGKTILAAGKYRSPRFLFRIDLATRVQKRILSNHEVLGLPAWSPDGKQIVISVRDGDDRVLCAIAPEVRPTSRVELWRDKSGNTTYDELWPEWSPDGKRIAFTTWEGLLQVPADGSEEAKMTVDAPPGGEIRGCVWSADGKRILFTSWNKELRAQAAPRPD